MRKILLFGLIAILAACNAGALDTCLPEATDEDLEEAGMISVESAKLELQADTLTKSDITAHLAAQAGITPRTAEAVHDALIEYIKTEAEKGYKVRLGGLGTFDVVKTKARTAYKPGTRDPIQIPSGKRSRFSASVTWKCALNPGRSYCVVK